jgi:hypothetical protein
MKDEVKYEGRGGVTPVGLVDDDLAAVAHAVEALLRVHISLRGCSQLPGRLGQGTWTVRDHGSTCPRRRVHGCPRVRARDIPPRDEQRNGVFGACAVRIE